MSNYGEILRNGWMATQNIPICMKNLKSAKSSVQEVSSEKKYPTGECAAAINFVLLAEFLSMLPSGNPIHLSLSPFLGMFVIA